MNNNRYTRLSRSDILEHIAKGGELINSLTMLCHATEEMALGTRCSILFYNPQDQCVYHAAAPSLPDFYTQAINGLKTAIGAGSCGTAAATNKLVIVEDIHTHPYWTDFLDLAKEAGFRACWSQPFFSTTGDLFGTFALYYDEIRKPTPAELKIIKEQANLASLAVQSKRDSEKLIQAKEKAERYLEIAEAIILETDTLGNILTLNRQGLNITGYTAQEVFGKNWIDLFIPSEIQLNLQNILARIMKGEIEPIGYYENEILTKNGERRFISWHNEVVRGDNGQIIGTLSSGQDVTFRHKMELQARRSEKMQAVGQLTGGIAHDFNNLLTIAIGNMEMAQEILEHPNPAEKFLGTSSNALDRCAKLVQALLNYSRQNSQKEVVISLNSFVATLQSLIENTVTSLVQSSFEICDDIWQIEVDSDDLENSLINLAINARDAMPTGGKLTFTAHNKTIDQASIEQIGSLEIQSGDFVCLSVSDTGVGMSSDIQKRIFEPFFTTKDVGKGTGLGMSMVYGFMQRSRGALQITSEIGKGTTVNLYFPRRVQ